MKFNKTEIKFMADKLTNPTGKFSDDTTRDEMEAKLKEAFREAVGGDELTPKALATGALKEVFALVSDSVQTYIEVAMRNLEMFVEYRQIGWNEDLILEIENPELFDVLDTAAGNGDIIAQPIPETGKVPVATSAKVIKIVQEFRDYLATDGAKFTRMIARVADSHLQAKKEEVGSLIFSAGTTQAIDVAEYDTTGAFDNLELNKAITHVTAKNSVSNVLIVGTLTSLLEVKGDILSDSQKEDLYNNGVFRFYNGQTLVAIDQFYKNDDTFGIADKKLLVMPSESDQFIKIIQRGTPIFDENRWIDNKDWQHSYVYYVEDGTILASSRYGATYEWTE